MLYAEYKTMIGMSVQHTEEDTRLVQGGHFGSPLCGAVDGPHNGGSTLPTFSSSVPGEYKHFPSVL